MEERSAKAVMQMVLKVELRSVQVAANVMKLVLKLWQSGQHWFRLPPRLARPTLTHHSSWVISEKWGLANPWVPGRRIGLGDHVVWPLMPVGRAADEWRMAPEALLEWSFSRQERGTRLLTHCRHYQQTRCIRIGVGSNSVLDSYARAFSTLARLKRRQWHRRAIEGEHHEREETLGLFVDPP